MGGLIAKKIYELSLVDYDNTRREEHAYIGHSYGQAKFFELAVIDLWELNESSDLKLW